MLKRTLLTMTALSSLISPMLHDTATAGQFNKPMIRMIAPQVNMRIDMRRLATRQDAKKETLPASQAAALRPRKVEAGPQPEPPTIPVATRFIPEQIPALPPVPRERPYNEFDDGTADTGNGADAGPATELSENDNLFDEDLIALLPGLWGKYPFDILESFGRGAIDGAFDNPPDPVGPFPPGNDGPDDLAGYNPGERIQPGGPNDPGAGDQIPSFIDDPRNPNADNRGQGPTNPSNVINDPRGIASDGPSSASHSWWDSGTHRTTVVSGDGTITKTSYNSNPDAPGVSSSTTFSVERENGTGMDIEKTYTTIVLLQL